MYPGFFKGMSSGKGGSAKEQKSQKQSNRNSNASDTSLPNEEFIDFKNTLVQFKKSLKHFSRVIFYASTCSQSSGIKRIHVGLGEVLDNLKIILEKYPAVASPEVFASIQMLINYVQSRQNTKICIVEGDRLINQLALYFTKSASQYVLQMRDLKNSADKIQGLRALKNSSSIFGIELEKHLNASKSDVPFIVTKCIKEVETHGLYLKGIYRVSAVKSKVHQLCEAFEKHGDGVSLTDINPNIIANVLKLYLRELPQPLFTFELYPEFIRVAKLYEADSSEKNKTHCIDELRKILIKLPKPYYVAASTVMQHLHRISNESTVNNMSAYNLAVIFGPTLLHCLKDISESTPGAALFDSIHQIRAIELMITWADTLFKSTQT